MASTKQLIHKSLLSFTRYFFPSVSKIYSSDSVNEAALLARTLCEGTPGGTRRDDCRAYLAAEGSSSVRWTANEDDGDHGRLEVVGTIRGGAFSADRLVHLPGHGDFQVDSVRHSSMEGPSGCSGVDNIQIIAAGLSSLAQPAKPHNRSMSLDAPSAPLSVPTEKADDLIATNAPDLLSNEQTWPTDEDMASSNGVAAGSDGKRMKRVPKGTSAYQAAWIFDDDDDDAEDGEEEEDAEAKMDGEGPGNGLDGLGQEEEEGEEETEEIELDSRRGETHHDLDPEQEEAEWVTSSQYGASLILSDMRIISEIENEHSETTSSSLTRLTPLGISLLGHDFNGIEASKASGPVRGIHMRTYR